MCLGEHHCIVSKNDLQAMVDQMDVAISADVARLVAEQAAEAVYAYVNRCELTSKTPKADTIRRILHCFEPKEDSNGTNES
jgi:hypothetical protein